MYGNKHAYDLTVRQHGTFGSGSLRPAANVTKRLQKLEIVSNALKALQYRQDIRISCSGIYNFKLRFYIPLDTK